MELTDWIIVVVGTVTSVVIAKLYGDMAALKAGWKLHEAEVREAKRTALRSLLTEVGRARKVGRRNAESQSSTSLIVTRLPVDAFSTAFSAGPPGVSVGEDLLEWVSDYLPLADEINCLVDRFASLVTTAVGCGSRTVTVRKIGVRCRDDVPKILVALEACLRLELGLPAVEQQLSGSATPAQE